MGKLLQIKCEKGKWSKRDRPSCNQVEGERWLGTGTIASSSRRILRAEHVRGMLARFICVISANTCGNACPSNANAPRERETALTSTRPYSRPRTYEFRVRMCTITVHAHHNCTRAPFCSCPANRILLATRRELGETCKGQFENGSQLREV